jgi:prepilin-type N-terminal cleavage/methylation domain-containing protein
MFRYAIVKNERGMSMLELMTVVVLIGVLAAMAGANWFSFLPRMQAKSSMNEVVSKLRQARSYAISRKEPCGLHLDNITGEWQVFIDRDSPGSLQYTSLDSTLVSGKLDDNLEFFHNTFSNAAVFFDADGSSAETGSMCFRSHDQVLCWTVNVLASTGRVRVREGYNP